MNVLRKMGLWLLVLGFAAPAAPAGEIEDTFTRGNTAYTQGNYKLALREYRQALNWPGEHAARAYYNLGVCHFQLKQWGEAVKAYEASLKFAPQNPLAAYALGLALAEQGKEPEALLAFGSAVEWSQAHHPAALLEYGTRLALAGDFREAANRLRQAVKLAGAHRPLAHNNLGVLLARRGLYHEAEAEFILADRLAAQPLPVISHNLKLCREALEAQPTAFAGWELAHALLPLRVE